MRVPDEAASTKVKVTLSFNAWKDVHIAPSTFELAVVDITPEQEAKEKKDRQTSLEQMIQTCRALVDLDKNAETQKRFQKEIEQLEKQLEDLKKP